MAEDIIYLHVIVILCSLYSVLLSVTMRLL